MKRFIVPKEVSVYEAYQYEGGGSVPSDVIDLVKRIEWPIEFREIPNDGIYWFDCNSNQRIYPGDWIVITDHGFEAVSEEALEELFRDATEEERTSLGDW